MDSNWLRCWLGLYNLSAKRKKEVGMFIPRDVKEVLKELKKRKAEYL
ncbi:hypothetical protein Tthe_0930 [Thermoanaerobacterium thermosaccharolyticum DSM 571]|uniref:Uncharacterized protein n=1 Tax=Thermoanaerobacterium thermosaccharolyticum (strain ATCC 7956 / DSM 571 / NCIMB 9385 / NCA 3814 / NCTC 13789 / WDCM 00135 / 2032) TaxID=580327 RepID=D9TMH8_THETC|nr:hypothetical protein Tthe_0930 [Thermoanaerobacterium thermosaccharolyticum DSM 571]MCP2239466.1 hypothetical protein [Thermoanaerobacterium thermosaccharolyticum]